MENKPIYRCSIANKWFAADATNLDELVQAVEQYAEDLKTYKKKGIILDTTYLRDGITELYTYDEALSAELGFERDQFEDEGETGEREDQTMH